MTLAACQKVSVFGGTADWAPRRSESWPRITNKNLQNEIDCCCDAAQCATVAESARSKKRINHEGKRP
jgi:hypothetical protein